MIENIEKLVSEDTLEMIDYLQSQKITGYEKVLEMLNDENEANNLSLFILEESKLYGGYAYKHSTFEVNLLEKNKEAIFEALKNRPELIIIHDAYLQWVNLKDINPSLSDDDAKKLKEELIIFLNK